jgi:hypothetical protein
MTYLEKITNHTDPDTGDRTIHGMTPKGTVALHLRKNDGPLYDAALELSGNAQNLGLEMICTGGDFIDEAQKKLVLKIAKPQIGPSFAKVENALKEAKVNNRKSLAALLDYEFTDQRARIEMRDYLRTLTTSKLFTTLSTTNDLTMMAAAIEAADLIGLDASLSEHIEERFSIMRYVYGPNSPDNRAVKAATFDNLAPVDPDFEILEKAAKSKWDALQNAPEHIENIERFLHQTLTFVASLAPDVTAREVYASLKAA